MVRVALILLLAGSVCFFSGCVRAPEAGALGEPCSLGSPCRSSLVCFRGVCLEPEPDATGGLDARPTSVDAATGPLDATPRVDATDAPDVYTVVDAPWDAALAPPPPGPSPRSTGPRLPPPPLGSHHLPPDYYDVVLDWERHRVFLSSGASGMLEVLNLTTGEVGVITTGHHAEALYFDPYGDRVVVALPAQYHDAYWFHGYGFVGSYDAATLTPGPVAMLPIDPWDVVADGDGMAYLSSGSGQFGPVVAADLTTGAVTMPFPSGLAAPSVLELHPSLQFAYGARAWITDSWETIAHLEIAAPPAQYESRPLMPNFEVCGALRIAPNGWAIYTACGYVFLSGDAYAPTEYTLLGQLDLGPRTPLVIPHWTDLAFSPDGSEVLTIAGNASIDVWSAATLTRLRTVTLPDAPARILAAPDYLVVVTNVESGLRETRVDVLSYGGLR